jgi:hypothetical protein
MVVFRSRERKMRLTMSSTGAFNIVAALAFFRGAKDDHEGSTFSET